MFPSKHRILCTLFLVFETGLTVIHRSGLRRQPTIFANSDLEINHQPHIPNQEATVRAATGTASAYNRANRNMAIAR